MEENKSIQTPDLEGVEMKMPENNDEMVETEAGKTVTNGPVLITLVVILLLILAALFWWFGVLQQSTNQPVASPVAPAAIERPTIEENDEPESTTAEAQTEVLETVSTSDEIEAIVADLESTDLDSLDAELQAIDNELEAALEELDF